VPWLAAAGPLVYCPELPPARDYFFQYTWVLPNLFAAETNRRRHYFFGAPHKRDARELFAFWHHAATSPVRSVATSLGRIAGDAIAAPLAVYDWPSPRGRPGYQDLRPVSTTRQEHVQMPRVDVFTSGGHERAETVKAFAHVGRLGEQQDLDRLGQADHRACESSATSTSTR